MNTLNLVNFFETAKNDSFFVVVVEQKKGFYGDIKQEKLDERILVCKNLFEASYVNYFIEADHGQIVCVINYDSSSFSIRAFVGQFRQVLYNLDQSDHVCVFYSDGFTDMDKLMTETLFILEKTDYGLMLGKNRAIPSSFLHLCEKSRKVPEFTGINELTEMLRSRNFEKFYAAIRTVAAPFSSPYDEENAINIFVHYEFITRIYMAVCWFFREKKHEIPYIKLSFVDLLVRHNGVTGFRRETERVLQEYLSDFSDTPVSEKKKQHIDEMLHYINENINSVSLSSLSYHFGLTNEYICRLFKTQYDMNFSDYIRKRKFEMATEMLQNDSDITIEDICRQIGYQSRSYFQNIFKKEFGITPDSYRKQYQKKKQG